MAPASRPHRLFQAIVVVGASLTAGGCGDHVGIDVARGQAWFDQRRPA